MTNDKPKLDAEKIWHKSTFNNMIDKINKERILLNKAIISVVSIIVLTLTYISISSSKKIKTIDSFQNDSYLLLLAFVIFVWFIFQMIKHFKK